MTTQPTPQHRTYTWSDPRPIVEAVQRLSGLEVLQDIGKGTLPAPPAIAALGIELIEVEPGRAIFELTPAGWHYNALGTVHGGVLATLADNALGAAVYTRLSAGTGYTTQGINITFLRPVTIDTGPVRCEGTALHVGRRTAYATATVTDLTGRLLAHATTNCQIFPAGGERPARTGQHAAQGTGPIA
ncbi:PaaI family thioesterase [Streptomyces sp. P17]|uniref:PaaI family thioesterase n=1 Tax=Streptomyces sp. P17 TaxID=3074716 RepID=UPI0028F3E98A|nr:PaaI family thioesterase [Streptomyces sp. P17]MDT9697987.1 PaaI family thioesterase [Streptomyces sp. P17]